MYGLLTSDYEWAFSFYPVSRLISEASYIGIDLTLVLPCDFSMLIQGRLGGKKINTCDSICFVRGAVPIATFLALEKAGFLCVNTAQATVLANDKYASFLFLQRLGIKTPKTFCLSGLQDDFLKNSTSKNPVDFPLLIKPQFGSRGRGLKLVRTNEDLAEFYRQEQEEAFIGQEFISESWGRDYRFFFVKGRIIAAVERCGQNDSFISNTSTGGTMKLLKRPPWWMPRRNLAAFETIVHQICKESALFYGSVDFLLSADGPLVCEINASPGFEALEQATQLNIAKTLIQAIFRPEVV